MPGGDSRRIAFLPEVRLKYAGGSPRVKIDFIILCVTGWVWTAITFAYILWRLRSARVKNEGNPASAVEPGVGL
jgi:hypothetical protein